MLKGMTLRHAGENVTGIVTAVSVMADGLAIARIDDRWFPVDELSAA